MCYITALVNVISQEIFLMKLYYDKVLRILLYTSNTFLLIFLQVVVTSTMGSSKKALCCVLCLGLLGSVYCPPPGKLLSIVYVLVTSFPHIYHFQTINVEVMEAFKHICSR